MSHNYLVEDVFKASENTVKRLLNHRPFTEGEIRSLVRTFEDKYNTTTEAETLDNTAEKLKDVNGTLYNKCGDFSCEKLRDLESKMSSLEEKMTKVLAIELDKTVDRKQKVEDFIRGENEKLVLYMQNMEKKMDAIDEEFEHKRNIIQEEFADRIV